MAGWLVSTKAIRNKILLSISFIILILFSVNQSEIFVGNFFYESTVGRIFGMGDKVFNTRTSFFETEQMVLFEKVFRSPGTDGLFGIGFEITGSGGSYRQWLLSTGIVFNIFLVGFIGFLIYRHLLFRIPLRSFLLSRTLFQKARPSPGF